MLKEKRCQLLATALMTQVKELLALYIGRIEHFSPDALIIISSYIELCEYRDLYKRYIKGAPDIYRATVEVIEFEARYLPLIKLPEKKSVDTVLYMKDYRK